MIARLPRGMHGGLFVSTGQIRGARLAERHGAPEVGRHLAVMVPIMVGRRRLRRGEFHDAEGDVQAAWVDDDGGVEPFDGRFVCGPGRQC